MIKTLCMVGMIAVSTVTQITGTTQMGTSTNTNVYYVDGESAHEKLLNDLESRDGQIVIEISTGTMTADNRDGEDASGHYQHYDARRFSVGDKIESVFIYNPATNYIDDILYRIDILVG